MACFAQWECGITMGALKEKTMPDSTMPIRDTLSELARILPSDASLEDVQYHLYVRQQIETGLADDAAGRLIDTDELRRRLAQHKTVRTNQR
jgi:predicted transcriptional regulator